MRTTNAAGLGSRHWRQFVKPKRPNGARTAGGIGLAIERDLGYAFLGIHFEDYTPALAVGEHYQIFYVNFIHGSACYNSGAKLDHYPSNGKGRPLRPAFMLIAGVCRPCASGADNRQPTTSNWISRA